MKIHIPKIRQVAKFRPAGYVEDVLGQGTIDGDWLTVTPAAYKALLAKYSPAKTMAVAAECCKKPKAKYPPLTEQARNAVKAGAGIVKAAVTGRRVRRNANEKATVAAICKSQTDGCYDAEAGRCRKCGCKMGTAIIGKWDWASEHCPKGLW